MGFRHRRIHRGGNFDWFIGRLLRALSQRIHRGTEAICKNPRRENAKGFDDYGRQRHGFSDDNRHFWVHAVVVRLEIFLKVCVFNHRDDYEQLFVVDFVLTGGVDLFWTRRRQMELRTRGKEVERMLVEKSKGRRTCSGDGGVRGGGGGLISSF